jgi:hypothetical protein
MPNVPIDVPRLLLAGLLATLAMSVAGLFPRLAGLPAVDMGQVIATRIRGLHVARGTLLAFGCHLALGLLFGAVYGVTWHALSELTPWLRGVTYGAMLWLLVMIVVMPMIGEGRFGSRLGPWGIPVMLWMHLAYGAILGAVYR